MALDLVLVERAGFVHRVGGALLADGARVRPQHPARDALFALGVSVGAYLLFVRVLN